HVDADPDALAASAGRSESSSTVTLVRRLNGVLPPDIRIHRIAPAAAGFDARFSALWRRYAYRIADGPEIVDPLTRGWVLARSRRLDLDAMNAAAEGLRGEHDFAAFCRRREGGTTIRTLLELAWSRDARGLAVATVRADAFCHNMVRALVGAMLTVGEGRREPAWAAQVLQRAVRDPGVTVVHAHGLTLEEVGYPDEDGLAAQARATRRIRSLPDERRGAE
ncbi:MAG: tRNA pseudouridine synthase A, partial [Nocardioidaceae bacterium]